MSDSPLLTVTNLNRTTRTGESLLSDVSFSICAGERWAVAGPTGSGKTLLLRALALLDPAEGELRWKGEPVSAASAPEYRSKVVYLAQASPVTEGTVEDNLRLPYQLSRYRERDWSLSQAVERCQRLGQSEKFLERASSDLSGGERQIVALLRVLPLDAQILLLDEATSALDRSTEERFESLVEEWLSERTEERAVVWVSHDDAQRQRVSSQSIGLERGRMTEDAA